MLGTWEQEAEVVLQGRNDEKHRSLAYYMLMDHHGQVQRGAPGEVKAISGEEKIRQADLGRIPGTIPSLSLGQNLLLDTEDPRAQNDVQAARMSGL